MHWYWIVPCILLALVILYLLSLMGRKGNPGLQKLRGFAYAHRGLHRPGRPENSLAAFRAALSKGYGMELDVHLLKDGTLAVIHDSQLLRTTGAPGRIEDLTREELAHYRLEGTQETIPTFQEVLTLVDGRVPLIVELKSSVKNCKKLCRATCDLLAQYRGVYCIESFDPRCVFWLRRHRPDIVRGQLAENYFRTPGSKLPWLLKAVLGGNMLNFLTLPDFVAYRYQDRKRLGNFLVRRFYGVQGVSWTLRSQQEYDTAVQEGWLPIFENFEP